MATSYGFWLSDFEKNKQLRLAICIYNMNKSRIATIAFLSSISIFLSCEKKKVLSYSDCNVEYKIYPGIGKEIYEGHYITNNAEYESAQRQLALCLYDKYISNPDAQIKAKYLRYIIIKKSISGEKKRIFLSKIF